MELVDDHYAILGVPANATDEQIEEAYRYRLRLQHPDLYPGDDRVQRRAAQLAAARATLLDPNRRAAYDMQRVPEGPISALDAVFEAAAEPPLSRSGKVVLTEEQAAQGCSVAWVQESRGDTSVRTLLIPAGTADGALLELPAEEVDGTVFPPLLLEVIVEDHAPIAMPEVVPDQQRTPKRPSPHTVKVAAATIAAMAVGLGAVFALGVRDYDPLANGAAEASSTASGLTAADELRAEAETGKAAVRALAPGSWVPQISSLCAGLTQADLTGEGQRVGYPDGRAEVYSPLTAADILAFHRALGARFTAVLSSDSPTAECQAPAMWVSLVNAPQPSAEQVTSWCAEQQFPSSSCTPRKITAELVASAQFVRQSVPGASLELPWSMTATIEGGRTTFTHPDYGATLIIAATPAGEAPTSLAAAAGKLSGPASTPTLSREEEDGFTVSGFTGSGDVYYWRQYRGAEGAIDVVWTYPPEARGTFDPAVSQATRTFRSEG
jgi:hypothetical protein